MKTVNLDGYQTAFISEDKVKISFNPSDIVEYEINNIVTDLFENYAFYGAVTFETKDELTDFLKVNSDKILNLYKNLNII